MSTDFNSPTAATAYATWPTQLLALRTLLSKMNYDDATNIPTGAIRWSSANSRFEIYDGSSWGVLSSSYNISAKYLTSDNITISGTKNFTGTLQYDGNAVKANPVRVTNVNGNPNISDTPFDVDGAGIGMTFESVGPTGSGATHIWSAMNTVPTGASWISVKVYLYGLTSESDSGAIALYTRKNGSSQGYDTKNLIAKLTAGFIGSGVDMDGENLYFPILQINTTSRMFDLAYVGTFGQGNVADIYLTGYGW